MPEGGGPSGPKEMTLDTVSPPGRGSGHRQDSRRPPDSVPPPAPIADRRVCVWGVPFAPLTMVETVAAIGGLIESGRPHHVITANTHYAMLTEQNPDLREINAGAIFIVADGAPLVWASRWM